MVDEPSERPTGGLALALALTSFAERLVAQNHRRAHPGATDEEVAAAVARWYAHRPGAPDGDADGVRVRSPRQR